MTKVNSAEEYKLVSGFQTLRKSLLQTANPDLLERPLAHWALPNDRRLPLAFLGRSLQDLLHTPFEELISTPGIGQKKISTLMKLLARATRDQAAGANADVGLEALESKSGKRRSSRDETAFDPAVVSEALWEKWRETVRREGIGYEKLGRLAPTLQAIPTVIWHTPLAAYLNNTVAEVRRMKTHGEKRVRTILEVFHAVHLVLDHAKVRSHLAVRLLPKFVPGLEQWIARTLEIHKIPADDDIRKSLVMPLLEQVRVDLGPAIARLAEGRLGIGGAVQSVRQQSRRMGVTRARVYQLLEECTRAMAVRWPEGGGQLQKLLAELASLAPPEEKLELLRAAIELFFADAEMLANRAASDGEG